METVDRVPSLVFARDTADPTAFLCGKAAASQGTTFSPIGDDKIPTPHRTRGQAWQIQSTIEECVLFLANKYYKA
jgi:hypothetical protein